MAADVFDLLDAPSETLIELARGDSPDASRAWEQLVRRHARVVWKVVRCFSLAEEEAWEAYQSTWLRAIEHLGRLADTTRFPGWLATIARNETLAVIRVSRKHVPSTSVPDAASDDPPVGHDVDRAEVRDAVRRGFGCLSPQCQALLRLISIEPALSYDEIERLLDVPHGSIGPTRRRCLEKLRMTAAVLALTGDQTGTRGESP
jgi:RNA polymerase sigma factor (sigma-70 family)